jgi:hypothetical protein
VKISYKKHQGIILLVLFPLIILVARFEDLRGSFLLNTIEFVEVSGHINHSDIAYGSRPKFRFDIKYQYQVNGQVYESNRVGFGFKGSGKKETVDAIIERYPVGKEVVVYSDKTSPDFSVLEPDRNSRFDFILVLFMYLTCVVIVVFILVKSRYNKPINQDK